MHHLLPPKLQKDDPESSPAVEDGAFAVAAAASGDPIKAVSQSATFVPA
jgi:hypothetical protein